MAAKNKLQGKLVYIEWEDSCGGNGRWTELEEMKPDQPFQKSIGWVMHESKRWIVIVPHISSTPDHPKVAYTGQGEMTVPKSAILRKKIISLSS